MNHHFRALTVPTGALSISRPLLVRSDSRPSFTTT